MRMSLFFVFSGAFTMPDSYDLPLLAKLELSQVMLRRNYRSHATLLDLPSRLFYGGGLVAAANQAGVQPPRWVELEVDGAGGGGGGQGDEGEGRRGGDESEEEDDWQPPSASLLFYGVRGAQASESDVASFYNPQEASAVADLITGLLSSPQAGVVPRDVGVMCTYRKQVQKVRLLLRSRGLGAIRAGTVDDFQGQEVRIVFISTVLTSPASLPPVPPPGSTRPVEDPSLGFWRSPKRFNVAVTRARALLVVVGHPAVLLEDASWRELLRHCCSRGAYRGAGASEMARRFALDVTVTSSPPGMMRFPGDEGCALGSADDGEEDADLYRTIERLAELALLGAGDADQMFPDPDSVEAMHAAHAEETAWRVAL
jgi:putative helicase MOV10L1